MLVNYDGQELPITILASQSVKGNEGWQALHSEILCKILERDGRGETKDLYHVYAPCPHTEPSNTCMGAKQPFRDIQTNAMSAKTKPMAAHIVASSTMPSREGRQSQSSRMKSSTGQNNISTACQDWYSACELSRSYSDYGRSGPPCSRCRRCNGG